MKKNILAVACICATMSLSSCGFGTSAGNIAGGLLTGALGGGNNGTVDNTLAATGGSMLGSLLSTVLTGGSTSQSSLVGTWTYSEPQVRFESQNILASIGGTVASTKLQTKLGEYLTKAGLTKGTSTYTFNNDGTYTAVIGKRTLTGTYHVSGTTLTMTGSAGVLTGNCTCTVNGNTMYMLYDADKLMNVMTSLTSNVSQLGTLSSILGNYTGMKVGMSFTK